MKLILNLKKKLEKFKAKKIQQEKVIAAMKINDKK